MQIPGLQLAADVEGLAELPWRATRYEGIDWLDLVGAQSEASGDTSRGAPADGEQNPSQTVLIRMAPGCGYPRHRHIGPEDVLVLAGGYRDEDGRTFEAGQFVRYPSGSEHAPVAIGSGPESSEPCILFAVAHCGTELAQDETEIAEPETPDPCPAQNEAHPGQA